MRILPIISALVLLLPFPALSDTGRLVEMLRMIPDASLPADAARIQIAYGDGDAVRDIARNGNPAWPADEWAHEYAAMRAAPPAQADALSAGGGEAMSLGYRDWVHALEVFAPPARMGVHSLFPDSEMRLRGALFGHGMELAGRNGQMVFWDGRTDHEARPDLVDPTNPFGGAQGVATRFIVEPERALWATGWRQIEAMQNGWGPALADRQEVAQAVSGLEQAARRHGRLVSVRMEFDLSGQGLAMLADVPVAGLFLADVVNRREEVAFMGLLFAPGTDIDATALRLRDRWRGSMLARWSQEPDLLPMPGLLPGFVMVIGGDWGEDEAAYNDALAALERALQNGTIAALLAP